MSRIGKLEIKIPKGVEVKFDNSIVSVKGPKGHLTQKLEGGIEVEISGDAIKVTRKDDEKQSRAYHGLYRSLINNMIKGVSVGFKKSLEISGVGYKAEKQGNKLNMSLGYSHPIIYEFPKDVTFTIEKDRFITLESCDKQLVGQIAANIRKFRKPEPYKGKGIKYSDEVIIMKEGKTK